MSNELDNKVAKKLRGYESPVDADALWQAVQPERKKRGGAWFFFGLLTLLLIGGLGYGYQYFYTATAESTAPIQRTSTVSPAQVNTSPSTTTSTPDQQTTIATKENVATLKTETTTPTHSTRSTTSATAQSSTRQSSPTTAEVNTHSRELSTAQAEDSPQPTTTNFTNNNEQVVATSTLDQQTLNIASTAITPANETALENKTVLVNQNDATTSELTKDAIPFLTADNNLNLPIATPPSPRSKKSAWFGELEAVYFFPSRNLSASDSLRSAWVDSRLAAEKVLEGISYTGTVGYQFRQGWTLQAGIGQTQINTVFNDTQFSSRIDSIEAITQIIYQPNNSIDTVYGMAPITETATRIRRTYNQISSWDIPLIVGYTKSKNNWRWGLQTGLRLHLQQQRKGTIWDQNTEDFRDWSTTDGYRTGLSTSLQVGGQLSYALTPKIRIGATLQGRWKLGNLTESTTAFQENYHLYGGGLFVRYSW